MKAYTDIEQSEKLAKILSRETSDLWYSYYGNSKYNPTFAYKGEQWFLSKDMNGIRDIPCWSLAALLSVLPRIDIEKEIWYSENYDYRVKAYIGDGYVGDWYDNPIDACVDMIVKLKKKNLL